jgi:hypothetical protein
MNYLTVWKGWETSKILSEPYKEHQERAVPKVGDKFQHPRDSLQVISGLRS